MTARAISMSNFPLSANRQSRFARQVITTILFPTGIAYWMYLLGRYQRTIPQNLMTVFAVTTIALAAGVGARTVFYKRNWFIRLITAWASLIIGLLLLGFVTNWKMGFGPLEFWRKTFDWYEIAQVSGGMVVTLIGLNAWRRPVSRKTARRVRSQRLVANEETTFDEPVRQSLRTNRLPLDVPESWTTRSKKPVRLKIAKQARAIERSSPRVERRVIGRLTTKQAFTGKRRKLFQHKPELQISVYEEHRCPYCFDDVKRNDPRGVKECSICHTLHHADCWDITGMCQVPHLNS